ncbi:MAG TPA: hypothetical protein VK524_26445 [Polyangiaceae bacterium]|nr:hypothetical protein [Polyangiaceae bacterium]
MRHKPDKTSKDGLGITLQYRERGGMAYDFGLSLRVRVFERVCAEDQGDWRVEARTSDAPGVPVITGWGATRADALKDATRMWHAAALGQGLPAIDWDVVTRALSTVRAI